MTMTRRGQAGSGTIRRAAAVLLCLFSGCATSSLFNPYPTQTAPLIRRMEQGQTVETGNVFGRRILGRDRILYRMEQGRLAQIQGDWAASRAAYEESIAAVREMDGRAVVSVSDMAGKTSALMINDNAIPYSGDGYERVMLHHEQALNYLFAGDVEGAGVEVRLASAQQAEALKRRALEVAEAQDRARREGIPEVQSGDLNTLYARLDAVAGRVKDSFQNAYTFYMSAVVREMLDDPGGAYIDYKKAAEIEPANPYVRADVRRLAETLGMEEESAAFRARWPEAVPRRVPPGQGEVIVFFEDGFLPARREFSVFIPLFGSGGWTSIALPVYPRVREFAQAVTVQLDSGAAGDTALICDLNALAARALRERMPAILTRQVVRATAKAMVPSLARGGEADILTIIMSLYSLISERADLRSWTTLPQAAQIMRTACPPGHQVITLTHRGTGARVVCDVEIKPGGRTIVWAVRSGGRLTARAVAFGADGRP